MPNGVHRSSFDDMRQSHRRSPTAPEPYQGPGKGKSRTAGEERGAVVVGVDEYGMRTSGGNATATSMPVRGTRQPLQPQPPQQGPVASIQAATSQRNALVVRLPTL
jgi:hypothetical protein